MGVLGPGPLEAPGSHSEWRPADPQQCRGGLPQADAPGTVLQPPSSTSGQGVELLQSSRDGDSVGETEGLPGMVWSSEQGAVKLEYWVRSILFKNSAYGRHLFSQGVRIGAAYNLFKPGFRCQMLGVTCQVSPVTCHVANSNGPSPC